MLHLKCLNLLHKSVDLFPQLLLALGSAGQSSLELGFQVIDCFVEVFDVGFELFYLAEEALNFVIALLNSL